MGCWTVYTQDVKSHKCRIVIHLRIHDLPSYLEAGSCPFGRGEAPLTVSTSAPPRDKNPTVFGTELQFEVRRQSICRSLNIFAL